MCTSGREGPIKDHGGRWQVGEEERLFGWSTNYRFLRKKIQKVTCKATIFDIPLRNLPCSGENGTLSFVDFLSLAPALLYKRRRRRLLVSSIQVSRHQW